MAVRLRSLTTLLTSTARAPPASSSLTSARLATVVAHCWLPSRSYVAAYGTQLRTREDMKKIFGQPPQQEPSITDAQQKTNDVQLQAEGSPGGKQTSSSKKQKRKNEAATTAAQENNNDTSSS